MRRFAIAAIALAVVVACMNVRKGEASPSPAPDAAVATLN
jgi:hypothetical protein